MSLLKDNGRTPHAVGTAGTGPVTCVSDIRQGVDMLDNSLPLPPGLRVLVVEDEVLIALDCEAMLMALGISQVRRARTVADGLGALDRQRFNAAILDVRLGTDNSMPLANRLAELGTPFGFLTGFADGAIPSEHSHRPVMPKPFHAGEVEKLMRALLCPT
jgi:DNA-binding NtrC family response regulator